VRPLCSWTKLGGAGWRSSCRLARASRHAVSSAVSRGASACRSPRSRLTAARGRRLPQQPADKRSKLPPPTPPLIAASPSRDRQPVGPPARASRPHCRNATSGEQGRGHCPPPARARRARASFPRRPRIRYPWRPSSLASSAHPVLAVSAMHAPAGRVHLEVPPRAPVSASTPTPRQLSHAPNWRVHHAHRSGIAPVPPRHVPALRSTP
jgi:hypothetical protein